MTVTSHAKSLLTPCSDSGWRDLDRNGNEAHAQKMKVRDVLKLLKEDGWYLVVTEGSHRQYKHPTKKGRVTVPGKSNDDLPIGTLNSILRQAGLKN